MKALRFLILCHVLSAIAAAAECPIKWDPQPDAVGFRVWRGIELLATTTEPRAVVDLPVDQVSTLTVTAYNTDGESEHSDPLPLLPVTPQSSTGLQEWTDQRTFFIRLAPAAFFRFSHPAIP